MDRSTSILVVDDNPQHSKWIEEAIKCRAAQLGCRVCWQTNDWDEALSVIDDTRDAIDVVISDLQDSRSKEFRGFDVIRRAREFGIVVIAISTFLDDESHLRDIIDTGVSYYVRKPFRQEHRSPQERDEEIVRSSELALYFALKRVCQTPGKGRGRDLEAHEVFVSYASQDEEVARELSKAISGAGYRVFNAAQKLSPGDEWMEEIRAQLERCRVIVPLITPNSRNSDWLRFEMGAAWVLQKDVIPALSYVDAEDLPDLVRSYQCQKVLTLDQRQRLVQSIGDRLNPASRLS